MATNPGITRNYHIPDGDLALFANTLIIAMTRDLPQQELYGVTSTSLLDLRTLIDEFQALPGDEIYRTDWSYSIEQRDIDRNLILNTMRNISVRAKAVFGSNSAKYRSMSPGNISQMTDSDLLTAARQVHIAAVNNSATLAGVGFTASMLTSFHTTIEDYEIKIDEVAGKSLVRDDAAEVKVNKGNQLYKLIVKYCDFGKLMWSNVSPSKYNDYVIYESSGSGGTGDGTVPAPPANLTVDIETMIFSWDAVSNAEGYKLFNSVVGTEWLEIYSGTDNFVHYVPEPEIIMHYKVVASNNIGDSPASVEMLYNYHEPLAAPGFVSLTVTNASTGEVALNWENIEAADFFRVYVCSVATGAPAVPANYSLAGEYTVASFSATFGTGMRKYFYVKSGTSGGFLSSPSDSVYADL
ncbi:MAG: hypothetical protein RO257_03245 [Candidatus Kapabacteria bacterium]|nr:hypothetical protein [Candidatus Kapabacteria bacterium]